MIEPPIPPSWIDTIKEKHLRAETDEERVMRRLARVDYDQALSIYAGLIVSHQWGAHSFDMLTDRQEDALSKVGWTLHEFTSEYLKRIGVKYT